MVKLRTMHTNSNGITLIALIITIIVMLILVGVTITVALNGGLFESATKAATETKKETEKEQLLSAVVGAIGTDWKVDSTKISLPDGFQKDDSKSTETKLVVKGKEGIYWEVNLNTAAIEPYNDSSTGTTTYTFTIGDIANVATFEDGYIKIKSEDFWPDNISNDLKSSKTAHPVYPDMMNVYNNVSCSDSTIPNMSSNDPEQSISRGYVLWEMGNEIWLAVKLSESESSSEFIDETNLENYKDISFTISM